MEMGQHLRLINLSYDHGPNNRVADDISVVAACNLRSKGFAKGITRGVCRHAEAAECPYSAIGAALVAEADMGGQNFIKDILEGNMSKSNICQVQAPMSRR